MSRSEGRQKDITKDEVARLRALLRDLVDFDIGEEPEPDGMCGADGPRIIANHRAAWDAVIAEVGPRDQQRYYNVSLAPVIPCESCGKLWFEHYGFNCDQPYADRKFRPILPGRYPPNRGGDYAKDVED